METLMITEYKKSHPLEYITIKGFFDATTLGLGQYLSNTPPDVTIGYGWNESHFAIWVSK